MEPYDRGTRSRRRKRPIEQRRPISLYVRLTRDEHDGLWALHCRSRRSKSQLIREAVVEYLEKYDLIDIKKARSLLAKEAKAHCSVIPPLF